MMDNSGQSAEKAFCAWKARSRFRMTGGISIPPRNRDTGVIRVSTNRGNSTCPADLTDAEYTLVLRRKSEIDALLRGMSAPSSFTPNLL